MSASKHAKYLFYFSSFSFQFVKNLKYYISVTKIKISSPCEKKTDTESKLYIVPPTPCSTNQWLGFPYDLDIFHVEL